MKNLLWVKKIIYVTINEDNNDKQENCSACLLTKIVTLCNFFSIQSYHSLNYFLFYQEDKEAMFEVYDTVTGILQVAIGVLTTLTVSF